MVSPGFDPFCAVCALDFYRWFVYFQKHACYLLIKNINIIHNINTIDVIIKR